MSNAYDIISADVYSVQQTFATICADRSINFEAEAGFAIQALMGNDYAMKIATSNRQSVVNAVTNIAAIGISLNPALKQAYLVPRDGRICLDISYMGLLHLAIQPGAIRWGQCFPVYQRDTFKLRGVDQPPVHERDPFSNERGEMIGVYSVVKTAAGDYLTHTMSADEVYAIRDRSSAWKAWIEKKRSCPWVTDLIEMAKKTNIKQAYKYWPKAEGGRLEQAVHYLNEQAGEGLHREETARGPGVIKATDGAMESMDREVQNFLRELAAEASAVFRDAGASAALDHIKGAALDNEQTVALWTLLASDMRSALKSEGAARKEAASLLANDKAA